MLLSRTISVVLVLVVVDSARILGIFPMPSKSHQYVFRALTMELARRGHELVVVTPDPALPKDRPPDNITEIDVSFSYEAMRMVQSAALTIYKRGVLIDVETLLRFSFVDIYVDQFKHPEVKKIIEDKSQKFDLIILESLMDYHLIATESFNAPVLLVSSFHGVPENFETVGTIARHPVFYPNMFRQKIGNLGLLEKINEIILEYRLWNLNQKIEEYENELLKVNFGPNAPTVSELKSNVDFLILNCNPIFCANRPVPPNVAFVGPLHLNPLKPLPKDLKSYLDNSKTGVIYVSLGTNVPPSQMNEETLDAFLNTFEALPYDILWKFDGDNLKIVPKNLKIQKWFPQRDLLTHPKIKLFVMQGGLQSTDEAIDSGVPLVAIPVFGDQFLNANKIVELGIGEKLDLLTLNKQDMLDAINKVLNNDSYRKNMRKLKEVIHDQPLGSMERAVWWTEYLIRHGGAKHLRSPAANVSWAEFLMADVLIAVALAALVLIIAVVLFVRLILSLFKRKQVLKAKRS